MMTFHSQLFLESHSHSKFHGSSHHQPGDDCLPITIGFLAMASMAFMAFMARLETDCDKQKTRLLVGYSYGHLSVISTYNPIYRVYDPIYNQL